MIYSRSSGNVMTVSQVVQTDERSTSGIKETWDKHNHKSQHFLINTGKAPEPLNYYPFYQVVPKHNSIEKLGPHFLASYLFFPFSIYYFGVLSFNSIIYESFSKSLH